MNTSESIRCLVVDKDQGSIRRSIQTLARNRFPAAEAAVHVHFSSLNYKDALAATGHPGVAKSFPLVPGIDAVGTVEEDQSGQFAPGQPVIVGHARFGTETWGGYSQLVRVPADWLVPLPDGLSPFEAMALGTAGFTAAQCVDALLHQGAAPGGGEIVVSGATGGVGVWSVMLLARLGFQVVASTGKPDRADWLRSLGASRIIDRKSLDDTSGRPLLSANWQGAVDTVGGNTLGTILRSTKIDGCVTACGLVGGHDLPVTVYPFILRGVVLHGIDSGNQSNQRRREIWQRLAADWKLPDYSSVTTSVGLTGLDQKIDEILAGRMVGRTVVDLQAR
jgi:putative YhdH/YhfP family quinone oxidoreductase